MRMYKALIMGLSFVLNFLVLTPAFSQPTTETTPSLTSDWQYGRQVIVIEQVGTKVQGSWKVAWRDREFECSGLWFDGEISGNRVNGSRYTCNPGGRMLPLDLTIKDSDTLEITVMIAAGVTRAFTMTRIKK